PTPSIRPTRNVLIPSRADARHRRGILRPMLPVDTRWKQRLESYERALGLLSSALKGGPDVLNDLEKEGTIRRFEFTLELGWKVLKDYLEFSGAQLTSVTPKSVVKSAFSARLLDDGQFLR